jgi:hypothetical protein
MNKLNGKVQKLLPLINSLIKKIHRKNKTGAKLKLKIMMMLHKIVKIKYIEPILYLLSHLQLIQFNQMIKKSIFKIYSLPK